MRLIAWSCIHPEGEIREPLSVTDRNCLRTCYPRCDSFTSSSATTASTVTVAVSSHSLFVSRMNSWCHGASKTQIITVLTDMNLATKYEDTTGAELSVEQD